MTLAPQCSLCPAAVSEQYQSPCFYMQGEAAKIWRPILNTESVITEAISQDESLYKVLSL